jgi:hypothetical protein
MNTYKVSSNKETERKYKRKRERKKDRNEKIKKI